jgi:hypothetical protein
VISVVRDLVRQEVTAWLKKVFWALAGTRRDSNLLVAVTTSRQQSSGEVSSPIGRWVPSLANGVELAHLGAPPTLARFLIVFAPAQLFLQAGSFQNFLETPQGGANRFPVMDTHP